MRKGILRLELKVETPEQTFDRFVDRATARLRAAATHGFDVEALRRDIERDLAALSETVLNSRIGPLKALIEDIDALLIEIDGGAVGGPPKTFAGRFSGP